MNIKSLERDRLEKEMAGRFAELGGIFYDGERSYVTNVFFMVSEEDKADPGHFDFNGLRMQDMSKIDDLKNVLKMKRGPGATIKLNGAYLKRVLDIIGSPDEITLTVNSRTDAVKITARDGKTEALLMPIL